MTLIAKRCSILCLLVISCMIGSTKVQAQSREDARKRSFAELLARRAKTLRAESGGAIAASPRIASRPVPTTSLARSTEVRPPIALSRSPLLATISPLSASSTGVSSATPIAPSGFGNGRDGFVESLYPQILGRNASQSEVDYWSGVLARGVSAEAVARLIWNSQEHRTLVRKHEAPGIPFGTAYRTALGYGRSQQ